MTGAVTGGGLAVGMDGTMRDSGTSEYRNRSTALVRRESKAIVARKTHGLVLHATSAGVPVAFAEWWSDLRRGRLRIYGSLLRFIDLSFLRGVPKHVVAQIPEWIKSYIDDTYDSGPPTPEERQRAA